MRVLSKSLSERPLALRAIQYCTVLGRASCPTEFRCRVRTRRSAPTKRKGRAFCTRGVIGGFAAGTRETAPFPLDGPPAERLSFLIMVLLVQLCLAVVWREGCGEREVGWLGAKGARPLPLCFLGHEGTGRGWGWGGYRVGRAAEARRIIDRAAQAL